MSFVEKIVPMLVALAICAFAAGCSTPSTTTNNAYAQDKVTTGSNIPKKGQAVSVDGSALQDQINRGAGGAGPR